MEDRWAHICSAAVDRPAADAMAFLQAPEKLASWAVGLGEARVHPDGTVEGAFPDTGEPIWARIDADPDRGTILYHLGPDPDSLVARIMIRVVPGNVRGRRSAKLRRLPDRLAPGGHGRRPLGRPAIRPRSRNPGTQAADRGFGAHGCSVNCVRSGPAANR